MQLTESQQAVLKKYLVNDETTWEQVCQRVAKVVASVEKTPELKAQWEKKFLSILLPMKFVPGGSILANAGHGTGGMNNCFLLGVEDEMESIVKLVADSLMTTKFRGGVGIHIGSEGQPGYVRPKGSPYSDGAALGPCAVLSMVSETSKELTTGNKARRGAFMFSMDWRHPDIFDFIEFKKKAVIDADIAKRAFEGTITAEEFNEAWVETHLSPTGKRERKWYNANISVGLDGEFFSRLHNKDPRAVKLWDRIASNAWATADPGLIFFDLMKKHSPIGEYIRGTNPCSEVPLPPDSSCNLGSIVISKFVNKQGVIDWEDLAEAVRIAVHFLDDVLDVSEFATADQKHNVRNVYRQLGLGIMGWADYLKIANCPYDSQDNIKLVDRVGGFIARQAYRASEGLAEEKGACGIWEQIKDRRTGNQFESWRTKDGTLINGTQALSISDCIQVPRRNSTVLSVAPTGSIAQLAGCSWAFEPDFGLTTWKQVFVDASTSKQQWVQILNPYLEDLGLSDADAEIVKQTGSLQDTQYAKDNPDVATTFKIAREVSPEWHILIQSRWQRWIDSSISKTINLPANVTVEEIKEIYLFAYSKGLKGITIYRSGTLESEPVKVGNQEKNGTIEEPANEPCPMEGCDGVLVRKDGCTGCTKCDYSRCGI